MISSKLTGLLALAVLLLVSATPAAAQLEATPFGGMQFGGSISVKEGNLNVDSAPNFGLILDYTVAEGLQIEASYSRQSADVKFDRRLTLPDTTLFKMATEYIHGGILYGVPLGNIEPFGTVSLGATHYSPEPTEYSDSWRFSIAGGLGAKYFFSERIGLRVQGRLMLAFQSDDGNLFCLDSNQQVCSEIRSTSSTTLQGDVIGGLIIAF